MLRDSTPENENIFRNYDERYNHTYQFTRKNFNGSNSHYNMYHLDRSSLTDEQLADVGYVFNDLSPSDNTACYTIKLFLLRNEFDSYRTPKNKHINLLEEPPQMDTSQIVKFRKRRELDEILLDWRTN
ncbi:8792_t:CDS:2 [Ambispora leptoticha]|uniref:8792_t:CDS:1 n=1 Tax=Ambispora leptoticha TaxID=144679 RepID=A0A9N8VI67_9GLOM|nr:8792_t:CDS:2 [Ambispora leptoticha]